MTKKKSPYSFTQIRNLIRHGLFLQGVRHGLAKIGIDIMPYYWVEEEYIPAKKPIIRTEASNFKFISLNADQIESIKSKSDSISEKKIIESIADGQECIGLLHDNDIAAYMFIKLKEFTFKNRLFQLKPNQAYLLNMYTFNEYRGKNLAPFLRFLCYRYLEEKGITSKFSVSNYFNKSAIRFKQKLNSRPVKLLAHIELFKRFRWHFVLKTYKNSEISEESSTLSAQV